jgi:hypothetical protein
MREYIRFQESDYLFIMCMLEWYNFSPLGEVVCCCKNKICQAEDGGLIGPMKSNPHLEKGKYGRIGCKGMAKTFLFLQTFGIHYKPM